MEISTTRNARKILENYLKILAEEGTTEQIQEFERVSKEEEEKKDVSEQILDRLVKIYYEGYKAQELIMLNAAILTTRKEEEENIII